MTTLIIRLMNSQTTRQCDSIIEENIESLSPAHREFICRLANSRKKHIVSLRRLSKKRWSLTDKN
jgi:hypothetical protein